MPKRMLSYIENAIADWGTSRELVAGGPDGHFQAPFLQGILAGVTDKGHSAYSSNEDGIAYITGARKRMTLVAADGIGGSKGGATAAQILLDTIVQQLPKVKSLAKILNRYVPLALETHHHNVISKGKTPELTDSMGTTYAAVDIRDNHARVYHQGDTKAIQIRGTEVIQATEDHTLAQVLIAEGAEKHTVNGRARHIVTNCIHLVKGRSNCELNASKNRWKLEESDWLVVGTDGLFDVLDSGEVATIVSSFSTPEDAVYALRKCVSSLVEKGQKDDNVSIIVYRHPIKNARSLYSYS